MPGVARSANTNHGTAMSANKATPLNQGNCATLRHCRVQVIHTNSTRPGSTRPIKPLLSTPKAQATKPARAQPACTDPGCSSARAKHQMAIPIQVATIVSWLTYWPPIKNAALAPSIQTARRATVSPAQCRAHSHSRAHISTACAAMTSRAVQGDAPNTANTLASSQYSSGGL